VNRLDKPVFGVPPPWRLERTLWPTLALLGVAIVGFEVSNVDLWLQDHFYNFAAARWWVDARAPGPRAWFYNGPKIALILLALVMLALTAGPARWRERWQLDRRRLGVALLTLGLVPLVIGQLKANTNVFCPAEIERYGGDVAYVKAFERHPPELQPDRRGRCYPAGHASGGFALFGLAGLWETRRAQRRGLLLGLMVGWGMGGYQMLKGAHYLSHTVVTMLLAWIGFLLIRRWLRVGGNL